MEDEKIVLGMAWQIMGFLGTISVLCITAFSEEWDYRGYTGIVGKLLGEGLMLPLIVFVIMFVVGVILYHKGSIEK